IVADESDAFDRRNAVVGSGGAPEIAPYGRNKARGSNKYATGFNAVEDVGASHGADRRATCDPATVGVATRIPAPGNILSGVVSSLAGGRRGHQRYRPLGILIPDWLPGPHPHDPRRLFRSGRVSRPICGKGYGAGKLYVTAVTAAPSSTIASCGTVTRTADSGHELGGE